MKDLDCDIEKINEYQVIKSISDILCECIRWLSECNDLKAIFANHRFQMKHSSDSTFSVESEF